MCCTWVSMVRSESTNCSAISRFVLPGATSRATSTSRRVSPPGAVVAAGSAGELVHASGDPDPSSAPAHLARGLQQLRGDAPIVVGAAFQPHDRVVHIGAGDPDVGAVRAVRQRARRVEMRERVVGSAEHRGDLPERSFERPTPDLASPCRHEMSERQHLVVQDRGEIRVAGPSGDDLGERRHAVRPTVVVRQRLLAAVDDLTARRASVLRPAALEAGEREHAPEQSVSRIEGAGRRSGLPRARRADPARGGAR